MEEISRKFFSLFILLSAILFFGKILKEESWGEAFLILKNLSWRVWASLLFISLLGRICLAFNWSQIAQSAQISLPLWYVLKAHIASITMGELLPLGNMGGETYRIFLFARKAGQDWKNILPIIFTYHFWNAYFTFLFFAISLPFFLSLDWTYLILLEIVFGFIFVFVFRFVKKNTQERVQISETSLLEAKNYSLKQKMLFVFKKQKFFSITSKTFRSFLFVAFLNRMFASLEIWIVGQSVVSDFSFFHAWALVLISNAMLFTGVFVPYYAGTFEWGNVFISKWLGYAGLVGASSSIYQRLRGLCFNVLGIFFVWQIHRDPEFSLFHKNREEQLEE